MSIVSFLSGFEQNCLLLSDFNAYHFTIIPPVLAEMFHAGTPKSRHDETNSFFLSYFAREPKNDVPRNFKVISDVRKFSTK
jgi:hypothetical protein